MKKGTLALFLREVENGYLVENTSTGEISIFTTPVEMLSHVQDKVQSTIMPVFNPTIVEEQPELFPEGK